LLNFFYNDRILGQAGRKIGESVGSISRGPTPDSIPLHPSSQDPPLKYVCLILCLCFFPLPPPPTLPSLLLCVSYTPVFPVNYAPPPFLFLLFKPLPMDQKSKRTYHWCVLHIGTIHSSEEAFTHVEYKVSQRDEKSVQCWNFLTIYGGQEPSIGIGFSYRPAMLHRLAESIS
jgi:hypothetical protein